jgi:hypothetical protein
MFAISLFQVCTWNKCDQSFIKFDLNNKERRKSKLSEIIHLNNEIYQNMRRGEMKYKIALHAVGRCNISCAVSDKKGQKQSESVKYKAELLISRFICAGKKSNEYPKH